MQYSFPRNRLGLFVMVNEDAFLISYFEPNYWVETY
jgi:hypothetical protein